MFSIISHAYSRGIVTSLLHVRLNKLQDSSTLARDLCEKPILCHLEKLKHVPWRTLHSKLSVSIVLRVCANSVWTFVRSHACGTPAMPRLIIQDGTAITAERMKTFPFFFYFIKSSMSQAELTMPLHTTRGPHLQS